MRLKKQKQLKKFLIRKQFRQQALINIWVCSLARPHTFFGRLAQLVRASH